ncbi:MAG: glycoside hydrolase family 99-like domain-containing protein [Planctomycetia bacterium]|nr:glycoside hydrolase family 99-like domain-containing protein [Planctomycetia bacterium]
MEKNSVSFVLAGVLALVVILGFAWETRGEEKILLAWEFNTPGEVEGWKIGGDLKGLVVENGSLYVTISGRDPILFSPPVEIVTKKGLVIEIGCVSPFEGVGEFFYANSHEGPFGGFSQEKSTKWIVSKDPSVVSSRFFPKWCNEGKVIKLRLDLGSPTPDVWGKKIKLDFIRIIDLNYEELPKSGPRWDFAKETPTMAWRAEGGSVWGANETVEVSKEGWKWDAKSRQDDVFSPSPSSEPIAFPPSINAQLVRLDAEENLCWCSVEMSVDKGKNMSVFLHNDMVSWNTEIPLKADGKPHRYNFVIGGKDFDTRDAFSIGFTLSDDPNATVVLKEIAFGDAPQGPPDLVLEEDAGLSDAINRVGRSLPFDFSLINRGGEAIEALALKEIRLPAGVRVVGREWTDGATLEPFAPTSGRLMLVADEEEEASGGVEGVKGVEGIVALTFGGKNIADVTVEVGISILPSLGLPRADYVPEPRPIESDYEIGALYFPGWGTPAAWERIFPVAPIRKPVLGWYDESNPEVIDWQIKWARENGIQYFLVDWYWNKGSQHLDHWVKGFQKARYRSYLKWAMMWANHNGPGSHSEEDQAAVTKFWIENYFNTPEYYTIDDKPVVMIWSPDGMDRDVRNIYAAKGVELKRGEGVGKLLALSRKMARDAGLKGIYFIAMKWPEASTNPEDIQWLADAGFDCTSIYHFMHHGGKAENPKFFNFNLCVEASLPYWRARREAGVLPFLPNLSTGWDSRPWHGMRQTVIYERTPEKFRRICEDCKRFCDESGTKNVVLAPLNEWGEGSYAEPNREFGFEMYEAVRDVFGKKPTDGWRINFAPADVGLGPYDFKFEKQQNRSAWDFSDGAQGFSPLMGVGDFDVQDGILRFETETRDPAIQVRLPFLLAKSWKKLVVRMRILPATQDAPGGAHLQNTQRAQLFWLPATIGLSEATSLHATIPLGEEFQEVEFPLSTSPLWRGQIELLRFDPCAAPGMKVEIDEIRFEK